MNIYDVLNKLNIKYAEVYHKQVFTALEAQEIKEQIDGIGCKNLFLTDKINYYLALLEDNKKADLKYLKEILNSKKLTFASPKELEEILKLQQGSVTPLGIINDINNKVTLVIDKDLCDNKLLCHPNRNDRTISIDYTDLIKLIDYYDHKYIIF